MAIGGYTTALLSADQHWNLLATLPASLAITFVCGAARRHPGAPPLRRLSRARDVRARGLGAAVPAQVLEVPRRQQRHPHRADGEPPLALRRRLELRRDRRSSLPGCCCGAESVVRSAPSATASSRLRRRESRCRSTRRSPSASPPPSPASPARCFVLATNGYVAAGRVRRPALAPDPDRGGRRRARLALGGPRRSRLHRPAAVGRRPTCPLIGSVARPGRRLRPDRRPDHAPAPERLRGLPPAL